MPGSLRIAVTADLHWGQNPRGDAAVRDLLQFLKAHPPDVLLLGGDQGTAGHFGECLELFADLPGLKALVPGNHDIWVEGDDSRGDSLSVYCQHLPDLCKQFGFHYLDQGPVLIEEFDLALAGSINWYDYSWSIERMRQEVPDWNVRLQTKRFSHGRHNDARFIRWPLTDEEFTRRVVATLADNIRQSLEHVKNVITITHHPAFYGLGFPREKPPATMDGLLWDALCGNIIMEELLLRHGDCVPFVFCGHTHKSRENRLGPIRGFNVGGDYHFKRLLLLVWPNENLTVKEFGNK